MYHPRLKGNPYNMGLKMGIIFKKANVQFPIHLDSFQMKFGIESGKILNNFFPEATLEIQGITDVMKIDYELFTSWMMCMGCCLDLHNGDSVEVRDVKHVGELREVRGCTAFSFTWKEKVFYGRNNDLPPFLRKVSKSIYYQPKDKSRFILNTSSFINGEEGINENGLVVAMTFVKPKMEEIKPGLNSVFLVRYLLENCKDVEDCISTLKLLPIASSCNILVVDKSGKMCIAELNPFQKNFRNPNINNNGENFIISVNHFTSEKMWKYDDSNRNEFYSQIRYNTVLNAINRFNIQKPIQFIKDLLKGEYGFMCQYKKEMNFKTIWSSIFNISDFKIYRAEGDPRRSLFREDKRIKVY